MTPAGHAAVSYVVARGVRPWIAVSVVGIVLGGVAPDLDFLVFWAPGFNRWHRVVTHNLLVCGLLGVVAGIWGARRDGARGALALGAGVGIGALLHVLTDSTMDTNPSNGVGVAWLWPWSATTYSPINLMEWMPVEENPTGWNDLWTAAKNTLLGVAFELPFWALAVWLWRRRPAERSGDG